MVEEKEIDRKILQNVFMTNVSLIEQLFVDPGESIKLHSRLKTDKIPAFWEKDGKYVAQASLVTNADKFEVIGSDLMIKDVTSSDEGYYIVHPGSTHTRDRLVYHLMVREPPVITIYPNVSRFNVNEEDSVEMGCYSTGTPQPRTTWLMDKQFDDVDIANSRVSIRKVKRVHSGHWRCIGRNGYKNNATISKSLYLQVNYPQSLEIFKEYISERKISVTCLLDGFPLPYLTWKINGKDVNEFKNTTTSASLITTFLIEDYKGDNFNEPLVEVVYTEYGSIVNCAIPSSVKETSIDSENEHATTEVYIDDNDGYTNYMPTEADGSISEVTPDNTYNFSSITNAEKQEKNRESTTPLSRIFHIGEKLVVECSTQNLDDEEDSSEETGVEEVSSSGSGSYYYEDYEDAIEEDEYESSTEYTSSYIDEFDEYHSSNEEYEDEVEETSSYLDKYDEYHSSSEEYEEDISASNENSVSFTDTFDEETETEAVNNVPEDVEESSSDNKPIEDIDQINKSNQHNESVLFEDSKRGQDDYEEIKVVEVSSEPGKFSMISQNDTVEENIDETLTTDQENLNLDQTQVFKSGTSKTCKELSSEAIIEKVEEVEEVNPRIITPERITMMEIINLDRDSAEDDDFTDEASVEIQENKVWFEENGRGSFKSAAYTIGLKLAVILMCCLISMFNTL